MKVLIACEYSGIVRDAFLAQGHDAISCDLLPTESPGPHIEGDVRLLLKEPWDLVIAHPPCSYLSNYNTAFKQWERIPDFWDRVERGIEFFIACREANAPRVAVENPMPMPSVADKVGPPDDYVEPYMFGHPYRKKTGLWLNGLPPLMRGCEVIERKPWVDDTTRGRNKRNSAKDSKKNARFWTGIAAAMAQQWGHLDQPRARMEFAHA